ncbi:hypothetical protein Bca4012_058563 [Brassica carinata]
MGVDMLLLGSQFLHILNLNAHCLYKCTYRLVARDTGLPSAAPLLREVAKVEPLTIAELNSFATTAVS